MAKKKVKVGDLVDITPPDYRNAFNQLGIITELLDDGNVTLYLFRSNYRAMLSQAWISNFVLRDKK
jgi:hypothetical protein